MSIIAIKNLSYKTNILYATQMFEKYIDGPFEPLNFTSKGTKSTVSKTLYIRLSERLDPIRVVDKINARHDKQYVAFVPEVVPDLPLMKKRRMQKVPIKKRMAIKKHVGAENPNEVLSKSLYELFHEVQYKYPGLYNISRKTEHKLLNEIASIIAHRLIEVSDGTKGNMTCFELTSLYRRVNPHFGDFQLILSTLHRLQDASRAPRMHLQEAELTTITPQRVHTIDNMPVDKIKKACTNYTTKVAAAIKTHVESLDCKVLVGDDENTIARKKVREEMKKMVPYLPMALNQVVVAHFVPEEQPHRRIRIYGEPFLPGREHMSPFTARYVARGSKVKRSPHMYNLLVVLVEQQHYGALKAMDGTVVSGAKLVIRDSDIPLYGVPTSLRSKIGKHYPGPRAADRGEKLFAAEMDIDDEDF